jgi:hypothetical protein
MNESEKPKMVEELQLLPSVAAGPLVFISHDSRDAELAEAFGKLLKSVSAGMIKTFRTSDKKGTEGIDFGDEWYKRLMTKLQATTDVVCLFTENSLDRPWILFEAGVAKGKLNTPVIGIALGVPLGRISMGPFYQFQNMDDSEGDLMKLVHQLARRISGLELDSDVVKVQVAAFKKAEADILKRITAGQGEKGKEAEEESPVAKLAEEIKALPSRVAERLAESSEPVRRRRLRRFHPMMFERFLEMSGDPNDPVGILMAASFIRDDAPWLYELAMEVYRAVKSEDEAAIQREMTRLRRFSGVVMHSPYLDEFEFMEKEAYMFYTEFPAMLEHMVTRVLEGRKLHPRRHTSRKQTDQP